MRRLINQRVNLFDSKKELLERNTKNPSLSLKKKTFLKFSGFEQNVFSREGFRGEIRSVIAVSHLGSLACTAYLNVSKHRAGDVLQFR